jgi:hypothetical protein
MLAEDLVVLLLVNLDIVVLGLERLIVLGEDLLVVLEFHQHGLVLFVLLVQLLVGVLLLGELLFYALQLVVQVLQVVLVGELLLLQLSLQVVGPLSQGVFELLDCIPFLFQLIVGIDDFLLHGVEVFLSGLEFLLQLIEFALVLVFVAFRLMFEFCYLL